MNKNRNPLVMFLSLFQDKKKLLIVTIFLLLISSIASVPGPVIFKTIIDKAIPQTNLKLLILLISLEIGLTILSETTSFFSNIIFYKINATVLIQLRKKVIYQVHNMSILQLQSKSIGKILAHIFNDIDNLKGVLSSTIAKIIYDVVKVLIIIVVLFMLNPFLTILMILIMPLFYWIFHKHGSRIFHSSLALRNKIYILYSRINEEVRGAKTINTTSSDRDSYFAETMKHIVDMEEKTANLNVEMSKGDFYSFLVSILGVLFLWGFGSFQVIYHHSTIGTLVAFAFYGQMFYGPLSELFSIGYRVQSAFVSMSNIFELLQEKIVIKEAEKPQQFTLSQAIHLDNVTFFYTGTEKGIKNVNLQITSGSFNIIKGKNGSGKSTLLNLLVRTMDPEKGTIFFDNLDLKEIELNEIKKNSGVVLQEIHLFNSTIRDNILFYRKNISETQLINAIEIVEFDKIINKLPDGLNTFIGENGYTLSGGERQKLALARAIVNDPKLLIMDEPTAHLDRESTESIIPAIRKASKNRTTIMVTHNPLLLENADRIIEMHQGSVKEVIIKYQQLFSLSS